MAGLYCLGWFSSIDVQILAFCRGPVSVSMRVSPAVVLIPWFRHQINLGGRLLLLFSIFFFDFCLMKCCGGACCFDCSRQQFLWNALDQLPVAFSSSGFVSFSSLIYSSLFAWLFQCDEFFVIWWNSGGWCEFEKEGRFSESFWGRWPTATMAAAYFP